MWYISEEFVKEEVWAPFWGLLKTSLDDRLVTMITITVVSIHEIHLIDQETALKGQKNPKAYSNLVWSLAWLWIE